MRTALALLVLTALASACGDPAGPPATVVLAAVTPTQQDGPAGAVAADTPAVRVTTSDGAAVAGIAVTFTVAAGGGSLVGAVATTNANGIARVTSWTLGLQPGPNRVVAAVARSTAAPIAFEATGCSTLHALNHGLGDFVRLKAANRCRVPDLLFDPALAAGHEYLLLLESLPVTGSFDGGLFPGSASGGGFGYTLRSGPQSGLASAVAAFEVHAAPADHATEHAWDFGAGRIRELQPESPPGGVPAPRLLQQGRALDLSSALADPVVGDTIEVRMEGLARLGIATGNQKAVIRIVTPQIIIAEDVRLTTTLRREGGTFNTPLTDADLAAITAEYVTSALVQGDLLFENRHNTAVEEVAPNRVIAVHSLMPADDVWGYTYSSTNYFVWDFWVGTNGSTKGLNQHPQRVADNLFMHEIAHMRHWGLLQRAGSPPRGNRWLVEGFARFSERLPIAARLLGATTPSRTGNIVLPLNPAFNNAYFLDDVPTYGSAGAGMFFGYQNSAFVFDYFADLVALRGGDWRTAVREFLAAAGAQATLDPVIQRWVGIASFTELFTRARVALYADDIGTAGLPDWTQYHTYQLRPSRALPEQLRAQDPRSAWPRISPGAATTITGGVGAGAAVGFVIAGDAGTPAAMVSLDAPSAPRVHVTLVRIR